MTSKHFDDRPEAADFVAYLINSGYAQVTFAEYGGRLIVTYKDVQPVKETA